MNINLPLLEIQTVYHIGTLNPADLGRNSGNSSYEGNCLSVSVCPEAWEQIARLGGNDLHKLTSETGLFVDVHEMIKQSKDALLAWAIDEKLVEFQQAFKAWCYDEDTEEWSYFYEGSLEDAFETSDPCGDYEEPFEVPGPDGKLAIEQVVVLVATQKLVDITGIHSGPYEDATSDLPVAYAKLHSDLDGAWWHERHDPDALSAPRGGIFPEKVARWNAEQISWDEVDDQELMEEFDERLSQSGFKP